MMTGAFKGVIVFAYIVACMFVLFFIVLVAAPSDFVGESVAARQLVTSFHHETGPVVLMRVVRPAQWHSTGESKLCMQQLRSCIAAAC